MKPKHRDRPLLVPPPPAVAGWLLMIGREGVWAGLHTVASCPLAGAQTLAQQPYPRYSGFTFVQWEDVFLTKSMMSTIDVK